PPGIHAQPSALPNHTPADGPAECSFADKIHLAMGASKIPAPDAADAGHGISKGSAPDKIVGAAPVLKSPAAPVLTNRRPVLSRNAAMKSTPVHGAAGESDDPSSDESVPALESSRPAADPVLSSMELLGFVSGFPASQP